jgi:hypothetical protein
MGTPTLLYPPKPIIPRLKPTMVWLLVRPLLTWLATSKLGKEGRKWQSEIDNRIWQDQTPSPQSEE